MSKAFFSRLFLLVIGGLFVFHSCIKERGELPPEPYNFNLVEGFENSANLPSGWTLTNPDQDAQWQVCTTVVCSGTHCIGFNNCSGNGSADMTGKKDRLITAAYDFTKATSVSISFNVAYAVLSIKNQLYTDTLAVFASVDDGKTWSQVYLAGGTALSNIPIITIAQPCWAPSSSSEWRTDHGDKNLVNKLAGHSHVKFAFENRSDWGEWIYIDNINITASSVAATSCVGITYAKTIQPLIKTQCATGSGCHGSNSAQTDLTSYDAVKSIASDGTLKKRMMDGNPSFMPPPPSGKLPDSTLSKVQCWIDAGAPNN